MMVDQDHDDFEKIRKAKQICTPEMLCGTYSKPLLPFVKEVSSLSFA
jgi:hypothetical protein